MNLKRYSLRLLAVAGALLMAFNSLGGASAQTGATPHATPIARDTITTICPALRAPSFSVLSPSTTQSPPLRVGKTLLVPSSGPATVGDEVQFVIVVENTGDAAISKLPLADTFTPVCLSYVSASPLPSSVGNGFLAWDDLGQLRAGDKVTVTVAFRGAAACTSAVNLVRVACAQDDAGDLLPQRTTGIRMRIALTQPTPTATSTPSTTITDTVTPTTTPLDAAPDAPEQTATATPTDTPTATPTATPIVMDTATPTATPTATDTATPTATPTSSPTTTNTPRPTATKTPTSTRPPVSTKTPTPSPTSTSQPRLLVSQTVDKPSVLRDEELSLTITVRNAGPGPAEHVAIRDELSSHLHSIRLYTTRGVAKWNSLTRRVTLDIGRLPAGGQAILTIVAKVADIPSDKLPVTIRNTALVSFAGGEQLSNEVTSLAVHLAPGEIPEPGTAILLGSGLLALAGHVGWRWKRR